MLQATIPLSAFQRLPESVVEDTLSRISAQDTEDEEKPHKSILCAACRHPVTAREHRISVNGAHTHVFTNPVGVVYEIGCFQQADGCLKYAEATLEHTWFPGFRWRFALCANCRQHLGWHYRMPDAGGFYGLILVKLVDERDSA